MSFSNSGPASSAILESLALDQRDELGGDIVQRQDEVDRTRRDRGGRHAEEFRRSLVLGDHGPASLLDRGHAHRAVVAGAGQDDRDRALAIGGGHRFEHEVRRGSDEVDELGISQGERPCAIDQHVLVRGRQVHMVRLQLDAFFGMRDRKLGLSADDLRHQAAVERVDVLDDDDDRSEPPRQVAERLGQGADAARRGGDRDYVKGGFGSNRAVQPGPASRLCICACLPHENRFEFAPAIMLSIRPRGATRALCAQPAFLLKIDQVVRKANPRGPKTVGDEFALLVSTVVDYAIFMLDPTGKIVTWNDGAQRIKGYAADEVIGRHFSIFYPPEDARHRKPDWELETAKREGRYMEEGWRLRKDGTRFWASVVITTLRDQTGHLRGFGKVTRDLTERQEQEEARNAYRDREEARLRAHADRMAELERTKTQFLNLASHELRGPRTLIRGYNSMLQDGSIPPEQIPAVARLLETKMAHMDLLVEQMLETARLEHDTFDLVRKRFDLGDIVQEQLDIFRPLSPEHQFIVDLDSTPLVVDGDP